MSQRKLRKAKSHMVTVRYDRGHEAGHAPAARTDKSYNAKTTHYIRIRPT